MVVHRSVKLHRDLVRRWIKSSGVTVSNELVGHLEDMTAILGPTKLKMYVAIYGGGHLLRIGRPPLDEPKMKVFRAIYLHYQGRWLEGMLSLRRASKRDYLNTWTCKEDTIDENQTDDQALESRSPVNP